MSNLNQTIIADAIQKTFSAEAEIVGQPVPVKDVQSLKTKYSGIIEDMDDIEHVIEVLAKTSEGLKLLHLGIKADELNKSAAEVLMGTCQVTFEEVPISSLIEYKFEEEDIWRVASLVEEALYEYKSKSFASWEEQITKPSCEAAFRRLLQAGPVSRVFDKHIFPTPQHLKTKYQVTNEHNGKLIDLPHPVEALRIWDAGNGSFRNIDPTLDGAPRNAEETNQYFVKLIESLKDDMGAEYIDDLMNGNNKPCSNRCL